MRFGETPVPIPNTTVKTEAADDTMLETAWESRWLPDAGDGMGKQVAAGNPKKRAGEKAMR